MVEIFWRSSPAHHQKRDYLIGGLLYCECNSKWGSCTNAVKENKRGVRVESKTPIGVYYCQQLHEGHISPKCPRAIGTRKADDYVWEKVCHAVNGPEILIAKAH